MRPGSKGSMDPRDRVKPFGSYGPAYSAEGLGLAGYVVCSGFVSWRKRENKGPLDVCCAVSFMSEFILYASFLCPGSCPLVARQQRCGVQGTVMEMAEGTWVLVRQTKTLLVNTVTVDDWWHVTKFHTQRRTTLHTP